MIVYVYMTKLGLQLGGLLSHQPDSLLIVAINNNLVDRQLNLKLGEQAYGVHCVRG